MMQTNRLIRLIQLLVLPAAVFATVWVATANSDSVYFPPLSNVLQALGDGITNGDLLGELGYSLRNLAAGLATATLVGGVLGLILGVHGRAGEVVMPILNFFRSTPHAAFVPAVILTLGIGALPKILLIAFSSVWAILLNTINGVRGITPAILETSASYRIPWSLRLRKVILPGALPQFLAGLRIAVAIGLVLVVISEIYGSAEGIGYFILRSSQNFAVVDTWAGTILIGIVGYILSMGLLGLEYVLLGWYEERSPRTRTSRLRRLQRAGGTGMSAASYVSARSLGRPLVVENLSKSYDAGTAEHPVLKDIDMSVEPGELVCIVGPSGVGKTTLLRSLSGLAPPSSGTVRYGDKIVNEPLAEIAVVFQDYRGSLMPWMKVRDNVAFPLEGRGVKASARRRRADEALASVGLSDVGDKYPWQLSGGMQQRVAIARGLAYESAVLVMDEPFGSVDAQTRMELEDLILDLRRRFDITVILVTHDIDEAVYLSDRVIVLSGKPARVIENVTVDLGDGREQLETRAKPLFSELRTQILSRIRGEVAATQSSRTTVAG